MANWNNPTLTSTYTNFVTEVKDRDTDLALQFDGTTSSNIPTNAIRWDSSASRWKKWDGTSWAELTSTYALTGLSTTGAATIGTTLGVTGAITGSSTASATAFLPTGSTAPTNGLYLSTTNTLAFSTQSTARLTIGPDGNSVLTVNSTSAALRITQTGTGNALVVEDEASDATPFAVSTAGDVSAGGSSTATSFIPTGSSVPTNGVYLPAANTVAISTNGSGKLSIDSSGNVDFTGAGLKVTTGRNLAATAANSSVNIFGGDVTTNSGANIELYGGSHATLANLLILDAGQHRFRSVDGSVERMCITTTGLVGIGTTSPSTLLHVNGTTAQARFSNSTGFIDITHDSTNGVITTSGPFFQRTTGTQPFIWQTNAGSTDVARIDGTGKFLVGTTTNSGTSLITLGLAESAAGSVAIGGATSAGREQSYISFIKEGADTTRNGAISFTTYAANAAFERARIDSSGRLLVGTTSTNGRLHVAGTQSDTSLSTTKSHYIATGDGTFTDTSAAGTVTHGTINSFGNPAIAASNARTYTNASTVYIDGAPTQGTNVTITNPYSLYVNDGVSYFAGNVGINQTSPGSTLDVKGTLRLSGSTSGYVGLSPAAAAGSATYTLPSAAPTANGQVLSSTTGGTLSWATVSSGSWEYITADTTWTKPSSGTFALVTCWGGGGGGGKANASGGGGGGACVQKLLKLADLTSTVAIAIGLGGAGATTNGGNGGDGGNTTFGSYITAYGGGGGGNTNTTEDAGGGGGSLAKGANTGVGGDGHGPTLTGAKGSQDNGTSITDAGNGDFGGGGGGYGARAGGSSVWGGGGGGGRGSTGGQAGGVSLFGGAGGAGSDSAGGAGTVPGGGGGAAVSTAGVNAGNGANGAVLIQCW